MSRENKTGRRLIFANGIVWENTELGASDGTLWLFLNGITLMQALPVITNQNATMEITFEYGEMSDKYTGYTHLKNIMEDSTGCQACLIKEA